MSITDRITKYAAEEIKDVARFLDNSVSLQAMDYIRLKLGTAYLQGRVDAVREMREDSKRNG